MLHKVKYFLKQIYRTLNRKLIKDNSLKNLPIEPLSDQFGCDRGTPIDRYYIDKFLKANREIIQGRLLEIAESTYSRKFGSNVTCFEILFPDASLKEATIIGDLSKNDTLPQNLIDCFICTQTFNFIYDFGTAVRGCHRILNINGVLLATVSGISQISRYDMDRWGDYWRFTSLSIKKIFGEIFGEENIEITVYGNAFAATCFLQGLVVEEVSNDKLDIYNKNYECIIGIKAVKR